ncbi:hypothetical protein PENTCL1PPCAC_14391, partial [Pristionchus entomophagus]
YQIQPVPLTNSGIRARRFANLPVKTSIRPASHSRVVRLSVSVVRASIGNLASQMRRASRGGSVRGGGELEA